MKIVATITSLSRDEIRDRALRFFNGRFDLHLQSEPSDCCINFGNEIGFVTIEIAENGAVREVTVRSREWDHQAQEFLESL
jgi:hypothetical protein